MSQSASEDAFPYAPGRTQPVPAARDAKPLLLTVVSTEEEFDWTGPFERQATSVRAASRLNEAQRVFDEFGVRPAYVVDYPIATGVESASVLREIHASGRCEIGAHLHPWVSPPFEEDVCARNSFPGNLPGDLEDRKLRALTEAIEREFGARPRTYQAGRYGFGQRTLTLLEREGYEVDLSASPPFDFRAEGGPDYTECPPAPCWLGPARRVLGIPITGAFVGFWRLAPAGTHRLVSSPALRWTRAAGVLARAGALERLRLSPEGFSPRDLRRLVNALLARGERTFVFSFHSPSLMPGCTPYVRDERGLQQFLGTFRAFYEFFLGELGGESVTPLELRARLSPAPATR